MTRPSVFSNSITILALLLPLIAHAQNDWLKGWREATVAVGVVDTAKAKDSRTGKYIIRGRRDTLRIPFFRVVGTAVIFAAPNDPSKTPYLVTAKHVFYDSTKNWKPSAVRLRFSWFADKSVSEYLGLPFRLIDTYGDRLWRPHPDETFDLAIIPLIVSKKEAGRDSVTPVRVENLATISQAFEGASVLIFGYPGAVGSEYWTKPLIRHGVISYLDEKHFGKMPILIDAMIFPGNSGGPVFTVPSGMMKDGSLGAGGGSGFLGIVSKVARQSIEVEKASFEMEASVKDTTAAHYKTFDYMGLGVIEPAGRVAELLNIKW